MRQHSIELLPITVAGVEAVNANSDISFGRHTHDQFSIGLMDSGGQKPLSGRGYVESNAGDVITVNPGDVHDGILLDGPRAWRMLYFDIELINENLGHFWGKKKKWDKFWDIKKANRCNPV
ncbi:AraC family ligand binding domain-containing protein [Pseudescherichia vulneris]|nr:AraC family ligand binding domain-containing protein [Pseudescherichia vulneris]WAH52789.1 AraC family ligand binding domain-containing protein [Pseudescherichia vulneris]